MSEKIKKIWLKNVKNGLIFQVDESELKIYQVDKTEVVIATEAEVEAYQNGTHWESYKAEVKTETPKAKVETKAEVKTETKPV